jgi:hypothetical protein
MPILGIKMLCVGATAAFPLYARIDGDHPIARQNSAPPAEFFERRAPTDNVPLSEGRAPIYQIAPHLWNRSNSNHLCEAADCFLSKKYRTSKSC